MHLPDGIIPLWQAAIYWVIVLIALALYSYKISKTEDNQKRMVLTALLAAASVAASSISVPSPFGVPMHFFLIPLVAIILGPLTGVLVAFICLTIQFFILGMGGITTLGGNTLTMGVVLSFSTYIFYTLTSDLDERLGVFAGTLMGIAMATITHILILLFAGVATLDLLLATLLPFYLFIAVIEGTATVFVVSFIGKVKPEMLKITKI
ncbi:energy-coupling factor ABC transporter permease [Methanobacterium alcaliphilum]|uniref:energy-coupling factor ABC transporter permease n=1 Tax=Methanobacterium alcaliphilum TaxID=392018 RepID=UPI00200B9FE3|nr:energy-coupling factor ABC transporter permease [Methanobacterium alcaliphilum]MCK9152051.1 energy-coupling factor ABC transporter permease [Methanobacterium alcaliphilum]